MSGSEFQFAYLSDPRLAAHALSPSPAWLWNADATRILWANPTAAAIFDCATPGAIGEISFEPNHPAAAQIARLLRHAAARRRTAISNGCAASARDLAPLSAISVRAMRSPSNTVAVLMVATERAGPDLALNERARRLIADNLAPGGAFLRRWQIDRGDASRDRALRHASRDLVALGAEKLAREASHNGHAEGSIAGGRIALRVPSRRRCDGRCCSLNSPTRTPRLRPALKQT